MASAAGKRARREPNRLDPEYARPPSRTRQGELGQAAALAVSDARNRETVARYYEGLDAFCDKHGFVKVTFQDVDLPGDAAATVYYLPAGKSLLPPDVISACAAAEETIIPQSSFEQGGKTHKHVKFPALFPTAQGRRILTETRQAVMPVMEVGGRVTEAELVMRSDAGDTPHHRGWPGLTADMHQDAQTGFITFERGGNRWLFDIATGEGREFELLRVRNGTVESLLRVRSRVIIMSPGAAGAGRIGCVWHRRWEAGATLSPDIAPPNPRKDNVAASLKHLPAAQFFSPNRDIATPEAVAAREGARYSSVQPSALQLAEQRAAVAAQSVVDAATPHCFACLFQAAGEGQRLINCRGLLLCGYCNSAGILGLCSAADRPAVAVGKHPEHGCSGCMPLTAAKRHVGKKKKTSFRSGKKISKKQNAARDANAVAVAAIVAAARGDAS